MMNNVFLLLGSNLGDAQSTLSKAKAAIEKSVSKIYACSSIYVTQAWGREDQPDFLNQVIAMTYRGTARALLKQLLEIETFLGRTRQQKWAPRTIDIDILFFGDEIIEEPDLQVPHPEIANRRFTLMPLNEIASGFIHPKLNKTIAQLLRECPDPLAVKKLD
jgi:2-amino-4-hydroxy-6-hydroxymethyldihydropteridine diphosphokinase